MVTPHSKAACRPLLVLPRRCDEFVVLRLGLGIRGPKAYDGPAMANRIGAITVVFVVLTCVMGCGDGVPLPAAPTSVASSTIPSPAPASGAQERWNLTRTFTGVTGAQGCTLAVDAIGRAASDSVLLVQRWDASMRLLTADHNTYVGTLTGNEFSATESEAGSTLECEGARIRFRTEAHVSGRFSSDGRALVGQETSVFLFESGRTITRRWDWQARRD